MEKSPSEFCFNKKLRKNLNPCGLALILMSCASSQPAPEIPAERPSTGTRIELPSDAKTTSKKDKANVDSLLGQIPASARDNNSEVSLPVDNYLHVGDQRKRLDATEQRRRDFNVQRTDSEIIGSSKNIGDRYSSEIGDIDRKLKVSARDNAVQPPSYTLGVQSIKEHFDEKRYEDALIEVNDLLRFYPRSGQLLTMKGTLHQRLGQVDLAYKSYVKAFEFEPSRKLQAQIDYLNRLIQERESLRKPAEGIVIPGGVEEVISEPKNEEEN